jgi:uncharacterized protein (TIGR02271 family)
VSRFANSRGIPVASRHETHHVEGERVIPVVHEELEVGRRRVDTGAVRITRALDEREVLIDEPVLREQLDIRRVPIGRHVEGPMEARYEGDVLVIPLVEEEIVISSRWVLREEVYVSRRTVEERHEEIVTLRSTDVVVDREPRSDRNG